LRIDYTTKEALNQHPDKDKLFVLGDTLLSESELFGEASLIMDDLNDRLIIEIDDEDDHNAEVDRSKRKSTTNQESSSENHPTQKRFRTLTHVM
jgi:hypothetical protein